MAMAAPIDTRALRDASKNVQELLAVARRTTQLLAESLEPDCSADARAELVALAQNYARLCAEVRVALVEQASAILGCTTEGPEAQSDALATVPQAFVPDASLAARTEAEIAARKLAVLVSRLEEGLPASSSSEQAQ